jgi:hypothetical protein
VNLSEPPVLAHSDEIWSRWATKQGRPPKVVVQNRILLSSMTLPHSSHWGSTHVWARPRPVPRPAASHYFGMCVCVCSSSNVQSRLALRNWHSLPHAAGGRAASRSGSVVLPHIHAWTVGPQYVDPRNVCNVGVPPLVTRSPNPFHPAGAMRAYRLST